MQDFLTDFIKASMILFFGNFSDLIGRNIQVKEYQVTQLDILTRKLSIQIQFTFQGLNTGLKTLDFKMSIIDQVLPGKHSTSTSRNLNSLIQ